jgi:hypothetical protein
MKIIQIILLAIFLNACTSIPPQDCLTGTSNLPNCPPANAVDDKVINDIYKIRTWVPPSKLTIDPIRLGEEAQIPDNIASAKIIGPSLDDAMNSLAAKIWLIENAQHTVDVTYYIFKPDLVGYSILGQLTTKKARVQVVIFNAITKFEFNRRSHDKLLIVDGSFADKAAVMTGGRNISLDYYGIKEDGSADLDTFRDLEILIRSDIESDDEEHTIGKVSEIYNSLLFLHKGNRRILPYEADDEFDEGEYDDRYIRHRNKAQQSLASLK